VSLAIGKCIIEKIPQFKHKLSQFFIVSFTDTDAITVLDEPEKNSFEASLVVFASQSFPLLHGAGRSFVPKLISNYDGATAPVRVVAARFRDDPVTLLGIYARRTRKADIHAAGVIAALGQPHRNAARTDWVELGSKRPIGRGLFFLQDWCKRLISLTMEEKRPRWGVRTSNSL